jgi:hypothetical protein
VEPLPEPSLTEPADIAAALFDSGQVSDGVVSLLDVMGVAMYDAAGNLVRPGADRGAGPLSLTEAEVRGLIEETEEDLVQQGESGGPYPLADMYAALAPSLPPGYSLDEFAAAYTDAYAADRDSLAAQVMRGQTIDADTGLLRVQMWLLLIDGFVGPSSQGTSTPGALALAQLQVGNTLGVARQNLPGLTSPTPSLTSAEWAELLSKLPTLAYSVPFELIGQQGTIHEGHGGLGSAVNFAAAVGVAAPVVSYTGNTLLAAAPRPGLPVTWDSSNEPIWKQHGSFDPTLGTLQPVDPGQLSSAVVTFTPKKEDANGAGTELEELGILVAHADKVELVRHSYDVSALGAALFLVSGRTGAKGPKLFPITWHELGDGYLINITWTDTYDGIPDTITFRGLANNRDTSVQGVNAYYTGVGTAFGSRAGWKSCNPGIDLVPEGDGPAEFQAGIQGNEVTIGAFPGIDSPLAGIFAGPFILPADGGTAHQTPVEVGGELCRHFVSWDIEATPFGNPRHP